MSKLNRAYENDNSAGLQSGSDTDSDSDQNTSDVSVGEHSSSGSSVVSAFQPIHTFEGTKFKRANSQKAELLIAKGAHEVGDKTIILLDDKQLVDKSVLPGGACYVCAHPPGKPLQKEWCLLVAISPTTSIQDALSDHSLLKLVPVTFSVYTRYIQRLMDEAPNVKQPDNFFQLLKKSVIETDPEIATSVCPELGSVLSFPWVSWSHATQKPRKPRGGADVSKTTIAKSPIRPKQPTTKKRSLKLDEISTSPKKHKSTTPDNTAPKKSSLSRAQPSTEISKTLSVPEPQSVPLSPSKKSTVSQPSDSNSDKPLKLPATEVTTQVVPDSTDETKPVLCEVTFRGPAREVLRFLRDNDALC
jgi:hypothetical protein